MRDTGDESSAQRRLTMVRLSPQAPSEPVSPESRGDETERLDSRAVPTEAAGPGAQRPIRRRAGIVPRLLSLLAVLLAILAIVYLGSSAYLVGVVTTAGRHRVSGTPADLGLAYEPVTFPSAEDHLTLQGWLLPAPT